MTTYRERLEAGAHDANADQEAVQKKLAAAEKKRLASSTTSASVSGLKKSK